MPVPKVIAPDEEEEKVPEQKNLVQQPSKARIDRLAMPKAGGLQPK